MEADPEARRPGRGAYVCRDADCARAAIARRGFARALRGPAEVTRKTLDWMETWPRSASTR